MKLLLVFLNLSSLDLYKFGQSLKPFDDVPSWDKLDNCSCPDGKAGLEHPDVAVPGPVGQVGADEGCPEQYS